MPSHSLVGSPRLCPGSAAFYTIPLNQTITSFNVTHYHYADDTQINLALDSRNFDSSIAKLTDCLAWIQKWMDGVRLYLNPEKTEFTVIGSRWARDSLMQKFPTQFPGNSIFVTNEVKNLGVTFDSGNTFASHITKVCCACYYLKDFRRICKIPQCGDCSPAGKLKDQ